MYASVLTGKAKPDKMDDVIRFYKKSISLAMKEQTGFKGAILLCNHDTRQLMVISQWESLVSLLAAEASAYLQAQLREMRVLLVRPLATERYAIPIQA